MMQDRSWSLNIRWALWLSPILALSMAIFLRLFYLSSIPPFNADEGGATMFAKNYVLFDTWSLGSSYYIYFSPFYSLISTLTFYLSGPGIVQARYLSVFFSLLSLALIYLLALRLFNRPTALIALFFLAFNRFYLYINRMALLETIYIFFIILTFFLWVQKKSAIRWLAGLSLGAAVLTKAISAYIVVPVVLYEWKRQKENKHLFVTRDLVICGLVTLVITAICFGYIYHFDPQGFEWTWVRRLSKKPIGTRWQELGHPIWLFSHMPFLALLTLIGIVKMFRARQKEDLLLLGWLIAGFLFVAIQTYQPDRYYYSLIPALCLVAANSLVKLFSLEKIPFNHVSMKQRLGIFFALIICSSDIFFFGRYFWYEYNQPYLGSGIKVVRWVNNNVEQDKIIVGPAYLCTSLRQRCYDFLIISPKAYIDKPTLAKIGVSYILFDDPEWRAYVRQYNNGYEAFLKENCRLLNKIGNIEIWQVG